MLPFGHIGFSYFTALLVEKIKIHFFPNPEALTNKETTREKGPPSLINYPAYLLTIFLPDLFDKTFSQLIVHSGRAFGHTLFFVLIVSILAYFFTKKNKQLTVTVMLGASIHLLLDLDNGGFVPFFWPFINYQFISSEPWTIHRLLTIYLSSPPPSEVMGLLLTIGICLMRWKEITSFINEMRTLISNFFHDKIFFSVKTVTRKNEEDLSD